MARDAVIDFTKEHPDAMMKTWRGIYELQPKSFRELIGIHGVGPRTISALASELVYKAPPSFEDPARFSFAHGGKDGHPFLVDRKTYEKSKDFLKICIDKAKVGDREKIDSFKRLGRL